MTSHETIVKIHDCVDAIIHHDKENARWTRGDIGMPAIQQDGNVVVPMQKDQLFLVNDNKKGVNQFAVENRNCRARNEKNKHKERM